MLLAPREFQASIEEETKRISRLCGRDNSLMVLAEGDAKVIGMLTAYGGETRRTRHLATLALGVARAHWGRGVATAMIEFALRWSREKRLRRIELTVNTSNQGAIESRVCLQDSTGLTGRPEYLSRLSLQITHIGRPRPSGPPEMGCGRE